LCAADIFAFPSHEGWEGMPNSLLEAMVMKVPAVAFAIQPILEIESGTGGIVIVPQLDSEQFSKEILRLAASSDERARIGEIGRAQVMERFTVRKNMAEAVERLKEVIQMRAVRARHRAFRVGGATPRDQN
jgi:glycosyltransferase involved in cell wall biosynthesis